MNENPDIPGPVAFLILVLISFVGWNIWEAIFYLNEHLHLVWE